MQLELVRRPLRLVRLVWRASRVYDASPASVARRAVTLRRRGFRMQDAAPLQLLDPKVADRRFCDFVPFERLNERQRRLSPPLLTPVIDDKVLFWIACRGCDLPTPPVRAILGRRSGWTEDGATPATRREWADALSRFADGELVAKPALGDRGEGVRAFVLRGGRFFERDREIGDGGALHASVTGDRRYDRYVLQDRLRNHDLITRLSGSETLQTLRIWTLAPAAGDVSPEDVTVLGAKLKFVSTDTVADNPFVSDQPNGFALIDAETGRIGSLVRMRRDGLGQEHLARHPRSGAAYEGVEVPFWEEALDLARRAAASFPFLRTLGWDVAVTSGGPLLLEANAGWGASNELGVAPRLFAALGDAMSSDPAAPVAPASTAPRAAAVSARSRAGS